jgi:site-specific DNA-methyltransferase (adenine-specific)
VSSSLFSHTLGFRSECEEWTTPPELLAELVHELGPFELDPCATPENRTAPRFFSKDENGLVQPWAPARCFVNPPYGRSIGAWSEKCAREAELGAFVVGLFPARTDTAWWHRYVLGRRASVRFLRGRVRFWRQGRPVHPAPFPSAVIMWSGGSGCRRATQSGQESVRPAGPP